MPAVSTAQQRFMQWMAHDPKAAKEHDISHQVAQEFSVPASKKLPRHVDHKHEIAKKLRGHK